MSKVKTLFMKSCTIAVIAYFFYPFFIETGKEIAILYERFCRFLWVAIKGNELLIFFCLIITCALVVGLVLWIVGNDEQEKEIIEETKKQTEEE